MPRGGKRVNAGRPSGQGPYGEKTKTIRVPESAVTDIKTYLANRQPSTMRTPPRPGALSLKPSLRTAHQQSNIPHQKS